MLQSEEVRYKIYITEEFKLLGITIKSVNASQRCVKAVAAYTHTPGSAITVFMVGQKPE